MSARDPNRLKQSFAKIADGAVPPDNIGHLLRAACTAGLCTKEDIARELGVQEHQAINKAAGLKPRAAISLIQSLFPPAPEAL